ncbi:inorganic phosphate transporter [Bradyrhizobium sp. U87765 SZCCT0131]|uniref:inorganic phosphate transporter n=1 Tax=unclassified Bradyrhizobium TaxID=2631580 RepID=UPI001BAD7B33|nr:MULTISPECIES: inorganic phosphate transporter [unclassified Bradyrhizobium]MBR1217198.1 inorganic phosphate transporter [Bradyrhizobium sp. U87765 SZCCT0131]MBR1259046.1 inorganic phosphate transporter [Bradyrhizobium sp. U87765 SZCCT0134]MBR1305187.1 inorganic phosphate transporter [Bradyrhizobium sp. U87765 SZCCT0110]MBR1320973.1 inorganic phosphate transporter [Bradyrhizobium sp. U87765 SZCCT0109]MBR1350373.1 inorganic phosphate transporter [Bradyrhizobium sp. U87765 SZCCT0048]
MSDVALPGSIEPALQKGPDLDRGFHPLTGVIYLGVVAAALLFVAYSIYADVDATGVKVSSLLPYIMLFVALLIALGFEFVNGFHDTANAVATVIYTRSMPAHVAVVWSGMFNLLGVLLSSGAVAFGIVSLLPVELILQVGSGAGFAMVFALLIAAIAWNVGTWYFGLPASSSHTLIGSIIGVGIANALMHGRSGTSGVDWSQATNIGKALLMSPLFGFALAAVLLLILRTVLLRATPALFAEPKGNEPPPIWIRGILVLTCTLVSFFHGSNDGQKGMGLIMLILIGTVPTAYALNRALPASQTGQFVQTSAAASKVIEGKAAGYNVLGNPRPAVTNYVAAHQINEGTYPSLAVLVRDISQQVSQYGSFAKVPADAVGNTRNDMYLASEAVRFLMKDKESELSAADVAVLNTYKGELDAATKFIPTWVKIAVAIALGLGTMVGWKRIVVTVGEKIGKTHLTYAQGACAEITAAATIAAADGYGLPVSTTHVLSSGIAGTMAANGSGLQWATIRNIALAWVLTLPAAMLLSGSLYYVLYHVL